MKRKQYFINNKRRFLKTANKVSICGIDTNTLPKASNAQVLDSLKKIKQGDMQAREMCIFYNMRLVLSIVQRFTLPKESVDDVFQVGMVGLIKAIDNFNVDLGVQFSTYAVPMIVGEIKRFQHDKTSIKISRSLRDVAYKALKVKEEIEKHSLEEANILEIAKLIDEPPQIVSDALQSIMDPISIFDNVYSDGEDSLMLLDQIKDNKSSEDNWVEKSVLSDSINKLSKKERDILRLRYYIGKTQTEISNEIGISQAQVSRLEKNALQQIYHELC